jgi:hypothetical protein
MSTGRAPAGTAHTAAWLLVLAFVALVLSVVAPAVLDEGSADLAAALLFLVGLAAALFGTGLGVPVCESGTRLIGGGLVTLTGFVLLFGFAPTLVALGVVLVGVALEIGSLPGG